MSIIKEVKGNEEKSKTGRHDVCKTTPSLHRWKRDAPNLTVRSIHTSPDTFVFNLL